MKTQEQYKEEQELNTLFERLHHEGAEKHGMKWLSAHVSVSNGLLDAGFDTSDLTIRTVAAVVVKALLDSEND